MSGDCPLRIISSYLREFEHITLARVLLARFMSEHTDSSIRQAIGLLERLLKAAQAGGRMGSAIEILVLQALANQMQGDSPTALVSLERALTLAEPEGYVRTFLDEGLPMAQLLRDAAARRIMPNYTGQLLAGFDAEQPMSADESPLPDGRGPATPASQSLIEPLSEREREVLRLLGTELIGPVSSPAPTDWLRQGQRECHAWTAAVSARTSERVIALEPIDWPSAFSTSDA